MPEDELDIAVLAVLDDSPSVQELEIDVLGSSKRGFLDRLSDKGERFRWWLAEQKQMFAEGFGGDPKLPIEILQVSTGEELNIEVLSEEIIDGGVPMSTLRGYITGKRALDASSWGDVNTEQKRAAFAEPNDSLFDSPPDIQVLSAPSANKIEPTTNLDIRVLSQSETVPAEKIVEYNDQWVRNSVRLLEDTYGRETIDTPVKHINHNRQKYTYGGVRFEGRSVSSCVPASTLNALDALGRNPSNLSEDDLIRQLGGTPAFTENGDMSLPQITGVLEKNGISYYPTDNLIELVRDLELGAVAIITSGNHARLVSGFESNGHEEMSFRVNDPLNTEVRNASPREVGKMIVDGINELRARSGVAWPTDYCTFVLQPNLRVDVIDDGE